MGSRRGARTELSRRTFVKAVGGAGIGFALYAYLPGGEKVAVAQVPGGTLDATTIPKFVTPLVIPPVMARAGTIRQTAGPPVDYYEISQRQFLQQVLPAGLPATTVWGYGALSSDSKQGVLLHHAPCPTIEAEHGRPVRVKWVNELVDSQGRYLPHLFTVDPTLHWANPPGGTSGRDSRPVFRKTPGPYTGPVPMVVHLHGAVGVGDESDGYPEAWFLPAATDLPSGYAAKGTWYDFFAGKANAGYGATWGAGFSVFQYPNPDRASTKWFHDHALGMTRVNVYAGGAGFYVVRGGPDGDAAVRDSRTQTAAVLPGPAPSKADGFPTTKSYYEIPIVIQDRAFNTDGSLFYPDSRVFFDGIVRQYIPKGTFSPFWNPEFFGNTLMVNGRTWPYLDVEQRRYRFRFLNGCQSRFLILDFQKIPGVKVTVIGNEGGFLALPVDLTADHANRLLMALAERADVIVDFTDVPAGKHVLRNVGPDEPFGGGEPSLPGEPGDFEVADQQTTGLVMEFRVGPVKSADLSTPGRFLQLPAVAALPAEQRARKVALVELADVGADAAGAPVEGPIEGALGVVHDGLAMEHEWMHPVTENPGVGDTEVWEIHNTTADAHPIHLHQVAFEVVERQPLLLAGGEVVQPMEAVGAATPPEAWESGVKDTVTAYPGQVTRLRAHFERAGQFVWHCHILEHEDNEMMRPFRIGPVQPGQPG